MPFPSDEFVDIVLVSPERGIEVKLSLVVFTVVEVVTLESLVEVLFINVLSSEVEAMEVPLKLLAVLGDTVIPMLFTPVVVSCPVVPGEDSALVPRLLVVGPVLSRPLHSIKNREISNNNATFLNDGNIFFMSPCEAEVQKS